MLTFTGTGAEGMNVAKAGAQVEAAAVVLQLTVTGAAKPATGEVVRTVWVERPAMTEPEVGLRLSVKSTPLPVSWTGKPRSAGSPEATVRVPVRAPVAVGLKLTVTPQEDPAASVEPHAMETA
jgi:hypothetical protein